MNMENDYDVIIAGGGPAGLAAAIYSARSGVRTVVLESLAVGGVAAATPVIENYPGFESISGFELSQRMEAQAVFCGAEIKYARAEKIEDGEIKRVALSTGEVLRAPALVLATGSEPRKLGLGGEKELLGAGLSYCATCDGNFFRGKTVAVVGGGSHAAASAEYLAPIAKKVYRIHSGKLAVADGVENIENARIQALEGNPLTGVKLALPNGERTLELNGLFVALGYTPASELIKGLVATDGNGYIICDEKMQTNKNGIFAAGDSVKKSLRQIATAVSDGAIAGQFAAVYAKRFKNLTATK